MNYLQDTLIMAVSYTHLRAHETSQDLRVVLSGEGADELFAGYIDYGVHTRSKLIKVVTRMLAKLPKKLRYAIGRAAKVKHFHGAWHLYANLAPAEEHFIGQSKVFNEEDAVKLLKPEYRKGPHVMDLSLIHI